MATIGIAIESGSMHAILFEPTSGEVLADRTTTLDPDASTALTTAIDTMRDEAATLGADVDAVGVVYGSDAERSEFVTALSGRDATLWSASEAFLGWLARSPDFADADGVLLYYMGDAGVSISLADVADSSLTQTKTAALDSMSPERIGSTVPLAWEVVDHSGTKPDVVALFGDSSSNRDLVDILSLGLGVPVVRVGDASRIAAHGAALLALEEADTLATETLPATDAASSNAVVSNAALSNAVESNAVVVEAEPEEPETPFDGAAEAVESVTAEAREPKKPTDRGVVPVPATLTAVAAEPLVVDAKPARSAHSGRKLVLAAVLMGGLLSAGVAVAATSSPDSESTAQQGVERRDAGADLVGATRDVDPSSADPAAVPVAPVPAIAATPQVLPPGPDPAAVDDSASTTQAPVTQDAPRQAVATPPPAWTPTTVEPPQFTVPPIIPEPGKSQQQLEQEAWDRHWQNTGQWLDQHFHGG